MTANLTITTLCERYQSGELTPLARSPSPVHTAASSGKERGVVRGMGVVGRTVLGWTQVAPGTGKQRLALVCIVDLVLQDPAAKRRLYGNTALDLGKMGVYPSYTSFSGKLDAASNHEIMLHRGGARNRTWYSRAIIMSRIA
jgi:hypothetical protein